MSLRSVDYSFGIGKEIADFVRHRLSDFGPYGLQIVITPVKGRFKATHFEVKIYTENSKGEPLALVNSTTIDAETRFHITDIAEAFRFEVR